jgi:uncharacterized protein
MNNSDSIEVVYCSELHSWQLKLIYPQTGVDAAAALDKSGLLNIFPWWSKQDLSLGVFSKPVSLDYKLNPGDRLEVYDDLTIDPKRSRVLRVESKRRRLAHEKSQPKS